VEEATNLALDTIFDLMLESMTSKAKELLEKSEVVNEKHERVHKR